MGLRKITEAMKETDEISKIGKNPYNRILMVKEYQGITYDELWERITNEKIKETNDPESLKKKLNKKDQKSKKDKKDKSGSDLVKALYEALGIESDLDNREALAVYHYMKNRHPHKGQPSAKRKEEWRILYEEAQKKKGKPDETTVEELLMNTSDEMKLMDEDNYVEWDWEAEFLKRALLVYRENDFAFDEIFEQYKDIIDWDKTDEIKITIS